MSLFGPGFVYFARPALVDAPVKIGWSMNPVSAVHEAMRWTWFQLDLVATVKVAYGSTLWGTRHQSLEATLHRAFAEERIQREWFSPSARVLSAVSRAQGGATADEVLAFARYIQGEI